MKPCVMTLRAMGVASGWGCCVQHSGADMYKQQATELRAMIKNAPHDANCNCSTYRVEGVIQTVGCTCSKAAAL